MRQDLRICVFAHSVEGTTGFPDAFVEFAAARARRVTYVRFPFVHSSQKAIATDVYVEGRLTRSSASWIRFFRPELVSFLKDFVWTATVGAGKARGSDFVLVTNNLLGFAALGMRKLGLIRRFAYLVVDYSPRRFANPAVEALYLALDRLVMHNADSVWTMSRAMLDGRERDGKIELAKTNWRLSPVGNDADRLFAAGPLPFCKTDLVYVGNPNGKNVRADLLVEASAELQRRGLEHRLIFLGPGDVTGLKTLARELGVEGRMVFKGAIPRTEDLNRELAACGIGLAPYDPGLEGNFSAFADPAKIKTYLGCSLPVITTSVPPNARELEQKGAGIVAEFSAHGFADSIAGLWADESGYARMREKSLAMGLEYAWSRTFARLMKEEGLDLC